MQPELEPHHLAWLVLHPTRDAKWLKDHLRAGFDVHHVDGDHNNNDPHNLVLIEHVDHMRMHGAVMSEGRLRKVSQKGKKKQGRVTYLSDGRKIRLHPGERRDHVAARFRIDPYLEEWNVRSGVEIKRPVAAPVVTPMPTPEQVSQPEPEPAPIVGLVPPPNPTGEKQWWEDYSVPIGWVPGEPSDKVRKPRSGGYNKELHQQWVQRHKAKR